MWAVEKGDVIGARRAAAERGKDSQGNDGEPRYGSDEPVVNLARRRSLIKGDLTGRRESLAVGPSVPNIVVSPDLVSFRDTQRYMELTINTTIIIVNLRKPFR